MLTSAGHLQKREMPLPVVLPRSGFIPGRFAALLLILCLGIAANCHASIFLTINGIQGDSTDPLHPGAIEVLSMSHGISRTVSLSQGMVTTSPSSHGEIYFTKPTDKTTPLLYDAATHGGPISSAEIDFYTSSPTTTLFYKIILSQVYVSEISTSGNTSGVPGESFTLFYEKITWSYIGVQRDYTASWDRTSNTGTNNLVSTDSDGDGLPDAWEMQYFGTLSYGPNDDPDHDGLNNYQEYIAGTNPNDANSVLKVTGMDASNGQVHLTWNSVAGKTYTIYSASQVDGPYTPLFTMPSAGDGQTSTNLTSSALNQFYRVGVP